MTIRLGINGRLDTIQAAILLEKLSIFDEEIRFRNIFANNYTKNLNSSFKTPYVPKKYLSSWAQYSIIAKSESDRDKFMSNLASQNIPSMIYYRIPLHLQKVFKKFGYKKGDFPISEKVSKQVFSIPMHPYLNNLQQNLIIEALNKV